MTLNINISNILHSDNEVEAKVIDEINYDWKLNYMKIVILAGGFGTRFSEETHKYQNQ